MEMALFISLAAITLVGAALTIIWSSPLRSAFSLLLCLLGLAGLYVTLFAHFLAAMQVLVYAGAVMVLFVFVVMLLGLPKDLPPPRVKVLAAISGLTVLLLVGKFTKVLWFYKPGITSTGAPITDDFGSIGAVGDLLFRQFLLPFEMISLLLLVAVVGAVVIARRSFGRETS
jgi:NADH-quinone oxidoreductase subunit J